LVAVFLGARALFGPANTSVTVKSVKDGSAAKDKEAAPARMQPLKIGSPFML